MCKMLKNGDVYIEKQLEISAAEKLACVKGVV